MIIKNFKNVDAIDLMEGVKKRVVIGDAEGAPNFIMRVFDVAPGHSSPYHEHPWEHEIFILEGTAAAKDAEGNETAIEKGDTLFIPPNAKHCMMNKGNDVFRFICIIPTGVE